MNTIVLIGQGLIGLVYVIAVVGDLYDREYLLTQLANKKLPYHQYLFVGAVALKTVCGLALLFNFMVSVAAFFLAGFTLIANIIFNNFWAQSGQDRKNAWIQFLIHMAIVGGLIVLVGV